jgi:hypothetical protein
LMAFPEEPRKIPIWEFSGIMDQAKTEGVVP